MRIALIGCGEVAPLNAVGIASSQTCELEAVMDRDEKAASDLGTRFGVGHTTSLDSILESNRVDTVLVAVPHHLHADITVQAASAGKHVIVEKPLATTLLDADLMIKECQSAGVALSVLFSFRYEPRVQMAKQLVADGAIGRVVGTSLHLATEKSAGYYAQGAWRGFLDKAGGGVLIMNASHMLDYMSYVTGLRVHRVSAEMTSKNYGLEVEHTIGVAFQYATGAVGSVVASDAVRGERWRLEERIWGTHGTVELAPNPAVYSMRRVGGFKPARWRRLKPDSKVDRLVAYFDRFAQAVLCGRQPDISGEDGRVNLATILAAYDSARSGNAVTLGEGD